MSQIHDVLVGHRDDGDAAEPANIRGIQLQPGERVVHDLRPSWGAWSARVLVSVGLVPITLGLSLLLLVRPWLQRTTIRYVITDRRSIKLDEHRSTVVHGVSHTDVRYLWIETPWLAQKVGAGNITLELSSERAVELKGVPPPET